MKIVSLLHCFIATLLIFLLVPSVFARQEMSDYQYQYEKYRDYYQNYLRARDAYLKYQTLTSQTELSQAGQDFLFSRAIVVRTYLQVIKSLLYQAVDVTPSQKTELILALDTQINSLAENEKQIENFTNPTFNELLENSLRLEKKANLYQKLAYQSLANILLGEVRALSSETVGINFLLEDKIKKASATRDVTTLNQWLQSIRDKTYQAQKNIESAEDSLVLLNKSSSGKDAFNYYGKVQVELGKARAAFLENLNYQKEILKEVENE